MCLGVYLVFVRVFSTALLSEVPLINRLLVGCYGRTLVTFCPVTSQSNFVYIIKSSHWCSEVGGGIPILIEDWIEAWWGSVLQSLSGPLDEREAGLAARTWLWSSGWEWGSQVPGLWGEVTTDWTARCVEGLSALRGRGNWDFNLFGKFKVLLPICPKWDAKGNICGSLSEELQTTPDLHYQKQR